MNLAEVGYQQYLAGVPCQQFDGVVDLAQFHAVRDEPVEVQPARVQQQQTLFPGFPEPASEDSPQGDAFFVDVCGDVDFGRTAGVADGDDSGFAADGFEKCCQGAGGAGAFEGDVEAAAAARQFAAALDDAVVRVQCGRAELFGLRAPVGVGVDSDDMAGAHEQSQVH